MDFSERQQEPGKKFIGIGLVVLFHIALVYSLATGLHTKITKIVKEEVEVVKVKDEEIPPPPPPPDVPPPPPPKNLAPPPPPDFIPPPEVVVQQQRTDAPQLQVTQVAPTSNEMPQKSTQQPVQDAPPAQKSTSTGATFGVDVKFNSANCPTPTPDDYPKASVKNEETGTTKVMVTFGASGQVVDVKLDHSSGYSGLDRALIKHLKSGICKANRPATQDGVPVEGKAALEFTWKLD
jgi:periplasmic protein TonB